MRYDRARRSLDRLVSRHTGRIVRAKEAAAITSRSRARIREDGDVMSNEGSDEVLTEQQIRVELGEILDQLTRLPSDAFPDRAELRERQAELGRRLREIEIPGTEDIRNRWSEAAGAKADHEDVKPVIVSPTESGGGGGQ